ncbi:inositol-1-monophosphatase [Testudinibacter sp. TR-2022]|uniref:inositol-1-monophosphatase n=1 Tax=Testudinibacter sp. TR-2022 TaxID=2585029 RepID=UPI0011186B8F|nr:inositol-1-monophosphatase [Testudinibacter sp. TR-2022]TNH03679.1 inositol-1-monophosphatase [Pasteurellaceae bacterium Phil31]TNH08061.1 inositol-1-monophosphatase [Testudinibacter sp. TR-2022]TNH10273.1 inositol-1-monophosphatase [Testudinibacter sp. TR-2022]TNH12156.1 inositol-1-monophosphatase [Testudinibacter sp. TR-2022]TNH16105.1 inositol-1-monophosphatase [Testudinibacter sp. TR-2022]
MNPMLNIAIRAARKAGNVIAKGYERPDSLETTTKRANDYVTNIDKEAEQAIIEVIKKSYPEHTIITEETGVIEGENKNVQWIIDPLDGTTNFIKSFPHFSVSIAIRENGRTEVGVVYDPIRNELFTAVRGEGAKLNETRLRVENKRELDGTVLATGFPFKAKHHMPTQLNIMQSLLENVADFRRSGSAALDLAYVAANRVDGYFEIGLKPWDCAAGDLIVREAGGIVSDFIGGHNYLKSGNMVAAAPRIAKAILTKLQPHLSDELKK